MGVSIDFQTALTELNGEPMMVSERMGDAAVKPYLLRDVAISVLVNQLVDQMGKPEQLSAEEKVRHAVLAQAIYQAASPIELKIEDVALLKKRIGRGAPPIVVMRAWDILDPPAQGSTEA